MPYNDNSTSAIALIAVNNNLALAPNYYTFNKMYIAGRKLNETAKVSYDLMIQGSINDYTHNSLNQILFIIPIYDSAYSTIKADSPITSINNKSLNAIFKNINLLDATPNILSLQRDNIQNIDINLFFDNLYNNTDLSSNAILSMNIKDPKSKITYNIIEFKRSNLWIDTNKLSTLNQITAGITPYSLPEINNSNRVAINVVNNQMPITPSTETDIYIDCSPTDSKGESVAVYTSKNLDQLNFFKINDLKVWAFRFITLFILLIIIFVVIKFFQISGKKVDPSVVPPSQPAP
jgi:hypothetical protein